MINATQARVTGDKHATKIYPHYTRYSGGLKQVAMADVLQRRPADVVTLAVRRMLPKTRLGGLPEAAAPELIEALKDEEKDVVIAAFVQGATLTEKGAVTYWYNCRRKAKKAARRSSSP